MISVLPVRAVSVKSHSMKSLTEILKSFNQVNQGSDILPHNNKGETPMPPRRIQELIQILWNEVNSAEDLQKFLAAYGNEIDRDFLGGIAAVIQQAQEAGNENAAGFFQQIGQVLVALAQASQEGGGFSGKKAKRKGGITQIPLHPNTEFDEENFLELLNNSTFLDDEEKQQVMKAISQLSQEQIDSLIGILEEDKQRAQERGGGQADFTGEEAEIKTEDDTNRELLKVNPNEAYSRAVSNLKNAQQIENDTLILNCAFTLGQCAKEYRPYPKLDEAIFAFQLASEKALAVEDKYMYAPSQYNLGNTYVMIPTKIHEERKNYLKKAVVCYKNALKTRTEQKNPLGYAMTQYNLANVYSMLSEEIEDNLRNAIESYKNALRVYTEFIKNFPQEYAMTEQSLGKSYFRIKDNREENIIKSISCYNNALQIYKNKERFPKEYAETQHILGIAYSALTTNKEANLQKAISCYHIALGVYTKEDFPQEYAATQYNMGNVYSESAKFSSEKENIQSAISCYEKALQVYTEKDFPKEYAAASYNLGNAYSDLLIENKAENLNKAITPYNNALRIYTKEHFPDEYAKVENNLASCHALLSSIKDKNINLKKAIEYYNNALEIRTERVFPKEYASIQSNLGSVYSQLITGDRGENLKIAIRHHKNALRIYDEKHFPKEYAETQYKLGNAYLNYFRSIEITKKEYLEEAIKCYNNTLPIYNKEDFPEEYAGTQTSLGNAYSELYKSTAYSDLYTEKGENFEKAIQCYNNALQIIKEKNFPEEYAIIQSNLGNAYLRLPTGDRKKNRYKAIKHYNNIPSYFEKDFPHLYATVQNNIGNAYSGLITWDKELNKEANLQKAITCYKRALRIRTVDEFPLDRVDTLFNMAFAYNKASHYNQALERLIETIDLMETGIRAFSFAETRRSLAENRSEIYHLTVSLCIRLGKTEEALSYAERGKSRTLVEMLHSAQLTPSEKMPENLRNSFFAVREKLGQLRYMQESGEEAVPRDFEIKENQCELQEQRNTLSFMEKIREILRFRNQNEIQPSRDKKITFRSIPISYTSPRVEIWRLIDEARNAYSHLLDQIRQFDPEFAASERVQPISVAEIQAMVPEKTVFVECFTGDDGTYIFVLDGKSGISENHLVLKDLTTAELFNNLAITNWLRPYYAYRQNRTEETRKAWHKAIENTPKLLAEKFWYAEDEKGKSLAALVETSGAERIVFMPHSGLHLLPLHLIEVRGSGSEVRGEGSAATLTPDPSPLTPYLMDKYEIAYAPSASMLRFVLNRAALPLNSLFAVANPTKDLLFTDAEVRGIAGHFTQPDILWYENAVKDAVLKNAGKASAVHFSCHGSFQVDKPLDSMLILAGETSDNAKNLSLKDIFAELKLRHGATVTLSACETGMVKLERGDEYVGLPSGFLHSGASSVISSLWAVDDLSNVLLMGRLYDNIVAKQMGKAAAIREAQHYVRELTMKDIRELADNSEEVLYSFEVGKFKDEADDKKPFAHPYYWGAFVCSGNWY